MALAQSNEEPAKELDVSARESWVDTSMDVRAGDSIQFSASGSLTIGQGRTAGPQGAPRGFRDLIKSYPVNEAGQGALIGFLCNSTSSGTVKLYDATSATGTAFVDMTPTAGVFYPLGACFNTGLYFVKTNTVDVKIGRAHV